MQFVIEDKVLSCHIIFFLLDFILMLKYEPKRPKRLQSKELVPQPRRNQLNCKIVLCRRTSFMNFFIRYQRNTKIINWLL